MCLRHIHAVACPRCVLDCGLVAVRSDATAIGGQGVECACHCVVRPRRVDDGVVPHCRHDSCPGGSLDRQARVTMPVVCDPAARCRQPAGHLLRAPPGALPRVPDKDSAALSPARARHRCGVRGPRSPALASRRSAAVSRPHGGPDRCFCDRSRMPAHPRCRRVLDCRDGRAAARRGGLTVTGHCSRLSSLGP